MRNIQLSDVQQHHDRTHTAKNLQFIICGDLSERREKIINAERLVQNDVVVFRAGNQIPADAVVLHGDIKANESLLTGEADEIVKESGSELMSGSFVVSGSCKARLTKVGAESYISQLTLQAKKMKTGEQSEMIRSLNRIPKP